MDMSKAKLLAKWLHARRMVLLYMAVVYACFFGVYALYGHSWGVAGYAALLGLAAGLFFAVWDLLRFAQRHLALARIAGGFPTAALPEAHGLIEADYTEVIEALEAERARLARESEAAQRDAQEYYTLWAHQIKTPMAAMRLVLQSSGEGLAHTEKLEVEQELLRIGQYVDMVLQYQRLASLHGDLVLGPVDLEALVRQAAKNCAPLFIHKGLALNIEPMRLRVVSDEKWMGFVLEQIFTNAVKHTPRGSVKVYAADDTTLVVEDTGVGIPPEDLPRVFERGFTGAVGRSERSSTGIGLYLCKSILEKLGFGISIESEPGRGTRVLLHLKQQALQED